MTSVQQKLHALDARRRDAALLGGGVGAVAGLLLFVDIFAALFAGAVGSIILWYFTSLSYWEYRDSLTLKRRNE